MTLLGDFEASIRTRYGPGGKKAMHKLKPYVKIIINRFI